MFLRDADFHFVLRWIYHHWLWFHYFRFRRRDAKIFNFIFIYWWIFWAYTTIFIFHFVIGFLSSVNDSLLYTARSVISYFCSFLYWLMSAFTWRFGYRACYSLLIAKAFCHITAALIWEQQCYQQLLRLRLPYHARPLFDFSSFFSAIDNASFLFCFYNNVLPTYYDTF